jgi:hypothetical protein
MPPSYRDGKICQKEGKKMKKTILGFLLLLVMAFLSVHLAATLAKAEDFDLTKPINLTLETKTLNLKAPDPPKPSWTSNIDFSVEAQLSIYQNKDLRSDGEGLKGKLGYKIDPYFEPYAWVSYDTISDTRMYGQVAGSDSLLGIGLGLQANPFKDVPIGAYVEAGYFSPSSDMASNSNKYAEGFSYYWTQLLNEIGLPNFRPAGGYGYSISGAFGFGLGVNFKPTIARNLLLDGDKLSASVSAGYQWINFPSTYNGYGPSITGIPYAYVQTKEKENFSGAKIGVGISYQF